MLRGDHVCNGSMLSKKSANERSTPEMDNNSIGNRGYLNQYSRYGLVFETLFFAPVPKIVFRQHRSIASVRMRWPYVRSAPDSDRNSDMRARRLSAKSRHCVTIFEQSFRLARCDRRICLRSYSALCRACYVPLECGAQVVVGHRSRLQACCFRSGRDVGRESRFKRSSSQANRQL
jgi:hypothetical protein